MAKRIRNVEIKRDNFLVITDELNNKKDTVDGAWKVQLKRLAVRMLLRISSPEEWFWNSLEEVELINIPKKVYLFDDNANGTPLYNVTGTNDFETSPRKITDFDTKGKVYSNWVWEKQRIIIPSSIFANKTDRSKAITFQLKLKAVSSPRLTPIGFDGTTDYTSPANTYYRIYGTLKEDHINFSIDVKNWEDEEPVNME